MIIGFTGTQDGMTKRQKKAVSFIVKKIISNKNPYLKYKGLHGDCIGADDQFNDICLEAGLETLCLPCDIEYKRAYSKSKPLDEPKKPLKRNKEIVKQASVMIATPNSKEEKLRSGTWATVRYTRKAEKELYIIFPDGKIKIENLEEK